MVVLPVVYGGRRFAPAILCGNRPEDSLSVKLIVRVSI